MEGKHTNRGRMRRVNLSSAILFYFSSTIFFLLANTVTEGNIMEGTSAMEGKHTNTTVDECDILLFVILFQSPSKI